MNTLTAVISGRRKLMVVELVAKVVLAFAIGLATSIALAGVVLLLAHDAQAAELMPMKPKEVQQGTLLLKSEGSTLAVPAVATEAEIRVSGIVVRSVVRQTYRNPYDAWFEGAYVFPLPENAAVDHLRMKVGELPQGATDSLWNLLAGLLTLLLAIGLYLTARRTPVALRSVK